MKTIAHTRQVAHIKRDTTTPQLLHALPIRHQQRHSTGILVATYTLAGFFGIATALAIVSLILNHE